MLLSLLEPHIKRKRGSLDLWMPDGSIHSFGHGEPTCRMAAAR
jgi:hypothetical protein